MNTSAAFNDGSERQPLRQSSQAWPADQYCMLDFGAGRKLERFGRYLLDRPSPAAVSMPRLREQDWKSADFVLDDAGNAKSTSSSNANQSGQRRNLADAQRDNRQRVTQQPAFDDWHAAFGSIVFNLKITPFGHVGLFPEQAPNWNWLQAEIAKLKSDSTPLTCLNLFAYTGGSTLAMAAAGASVVHVDASGPAVNWARQNAFSSGLQELPVRWITEDARKFVARELRRGNRYDIIVMDPPSYGHGPTGKRWSIEADLPELLVNSLQLLRTRLPSRLLFTAHCERPSRSQVARMLDREYGQQVIEQGELSLHDAANRRLNAGFFLRVVRQ